MSRSTDEAKQGIDQLAAQSEVALRRSQRNLEAVADAGGCVMQGAQDISMAWMKLAQARAQRMAEGFRILATCRTPAELIHAQSELVRGGLEQVVDTNRHVADVSMRMMQDVAARMTRPLSDRGA
jgi:phasin family protein